MSVTAAKGFEAAGIAAGIKENGNPDLALVVNHGPRLAAAGVFTSNRVKAAPVLWSEQVLKGGQVAAVVLNSGGANACTGPKGFQDTHATAEKTAEALGVNAAEVAVASTGLIGVTLPMDKLLPGVEAAAAALSPHGGEKAAIAIKTTDSVHKTAVFEGEGWTVGGMAKGAGMLALAEAVRSVCDDLARQLIGDAEGASKDIRIEVVGASSEDDAVEVGRSIARNNLLKCAIHGEDPNWGRVLSAIGTTGAAFEPDRLNVARPREQRLLVLSPAGPHGPAPGGPS